jgi:hypothetical protein
VAAPRTPIQVTRAGRVRRPPAPVKRDGPYPRREDPGRRPRSRNNPIVADPAGRPNKTTPAGFVVRRPVPFPVIILRRRGPAADLIVIIFPRLRSPLLRRCCWGLCGRPGRSAIRRPEVKEPSPVVTLYPFTGRGRSERFLPPIQRAEEHGGLMEPAGVRVRIRSTCRSVGRSSGTYFSLVNRQNFGEDDTPLAAAKSLTYTCRTISQICSFSFYSFMSSS